MTNQDHEDEIIDEVKAIEKQRVLIGFLGRTEAINRLKIGDKIRNPIDPTKSEEEIRNIEQEKTEEFEKVWKEAQNSIDNDPPSFLPGNLDMGQFPEEESIAEYLDEFEQQEHFQKLVQDVPDDQWYYALLPIRQLVAAQPRVTKTAHREIPTSDDGLLQVIQECLPIRGRKYLMTSQIQTNQSVGYQIVSRGPNINIGEPSIERDEETDDVRIEFTLKPNTNIVLAKELPDRFVLHNGYHRCFQLLQKGDTHVPALVMKADDARQTIAIKQGMFDPDVILQSRPPLIHDFTSEAAADIDSPAQNKVFRVLAQQMNIRR